MRVEFRTGSSLLVAYSVNVSRGGMFVRTDMSLGIGEAITLSLVVPGEPAIAVMGTVAWCRRANSPDGPPGIGVAFESISAELGAAIDRHITSYDGVTMLLLVGNRQDGETVQRQLRGSVTSADVLLAGDVAEARSQLTSAIDLLVVDLNSDPAGGLALLRTANELVPPVPTLALAATEQLRGEARAAGAAEVCSSPPDFDELGMYVLRALSLPVAVRES